MKVGDNMYKLTIIYERNGKEFILTWQMEDIDEVTEMLPDNIKILVDCQYHIKKVMIE